MKNLLMVMMGLLPFLSSSAFARTQTMLAGEAQTPFSVAGGVLGRGAGYDIGPANHGYGLKGLGGNVGFSHYVGHDFEYGIDLAGSYSSNIRGKLFDNKIKSGFRGNLTLGARYLPQMSDSFRVGGLVDVGYGRLFSEADKAYHDAYSFGDMYFNIGPAFIHQATESFSWGLGLTYGLSDIRLGAKSNVHQRVKQYSNLHTLRLPVDFLMRATDNLAVAIGLESSWRYLGKNHKFHHGVYNELSMGVVYRI